MDPWKNWEKVREARQRYNLNPAECVMVYAMNAEALGDRDVLMNRLKTDLQAAISVELATIPIYLYTYYSINRTVSNAESLTDTAHFANEAGAVIMSVAVEEMLHMSLSSNIFFALTGTPPKLYMQAPKDYPTLLPAHNPVGPPGPNGSTDNHIPLKGLSFEQLWHFLQIEYPQGPVDGIMDGIELFMPELGWLETKLPGIVADELGKLLHAVGWPSDQKWNSIGQFYSFIRCMIASELIYDDDFKTGHPQRQIQPYNYAPNNIDTIYPDRKFNDQAVAPNPDTPLEPIGDFPSAAEVAKYTNEPDSHSGSQDHDWEQDEELIAVWSKEGAMMALLTICEQGEGYKDDTGAEETTADPDQSGGEGPSDTRNYEPEESHFFKFLRLQAQFKDYDEHKEQLPIWMQGEIEEMELEERLEDQYAKRTAADLIAGKYVYDFPDSPTSALYPKAYAALNDFNSGLFQYMLVLSETIYLIKPEMLGPDCTIHSQHKFFNIALHRSMIWVMDKWIQMMRELPAGTDGAFKGKILAPSFENHDLGTREESFANLKTLGTAAIAAAKSIDAAAPTASPIAPRVTDLVNKAMTLTSTNRDGVTYPMHLPDVRAYWNGDAPINPGEDGGEVAEWLMGEKQ